jgi:hypothetical protein
MTLREREDKAAAVLEARGVMISRPGEGHPQSDVFDCWGVCVGSHGGYAKTLVGAMSRCLRCCGIGKWWQVRPPEDQELLSNLFARVKKEISANERAHI